MIRRKKIVKIQKKNQKRVHIIKINKRKITIIKMIKKVILKIAILKITTDFEIMIFFEKINFLNYLINNQIIDNTNHIIYILDICNYNIDIITIKNINRKFNAYTSYKQIINFLLQNIFDISHYLDTSLLCFV